MLVTVVALAGCGSSKNQSRDAKVGLRGRPTMGPYLFDIRGAIKSLKAQGITVRRTGRAAVAGKSLPAPEKSAAFEADGTPFTLLLFGSEDLANDAAPSLSKLPGDVVVGKNILAIIRPEGRSYDRVRQAIISLGDNPPGPEPRFPAKGEPSS